MTLINIDPNIRLANKLTFVGFEDVVDTESVIIGAKSVFEGESVSLLVEETDLIGSGIISNIYNDLELIFIKVDWDSFHPRYHQSIEGIFDGPTDSWKRVKFTDGLRDE